jgi:hypothetical protein
MRLDDRVGLHELIQYQFSALTLLQNPTNDDDEISGWRNLKIK